ncbi:hypothetical protein GF386_05150 [Candidatus Pacearchaeota archaeon]|nr:hypothetical protein [Candidatus Pacearchaeota archaeon]MBD3283498.1 hypothetical protein [Candidatus Pacearchaeota archaeon]
MKRKIFPSSKHTNSRSELAKLKRILPSSKRSQSQVVTTVLLILIVMVTTGIIIGFVVPLVRNQLSEGDCLQFINKIEISSNNQYTCYNNTASYMLVQIRMGDIEEELGGIVIEAGGATTQTFEIKDGAAPDDVEMYDGGNIEIPGRNEARTYNLTTVNSQPEIIKVYPLMVNNRTCSAADVLNTISVCV